MFYLKIMAGACVRLEDEKGATLAEKTASAPFYMAASFLQAVLPCACDGCNGSVLLFEHQSGHLLVVDTKDAEIVATSIALKEIQRQARKGKQKQKPKKSKALGQNPKDALAEWPEQLEDKE
jgi:hypothetical protein